MYDDLAKRLYLISAKLDFCTIEAVSGLTVPIAFCESVSSSYTLKRQRCHESNSDESGHTINHLDGI